MIVSKVNTAVQIGAILVVLLSGLTESLDGIALGSLYLVAALTVLSGLLYIQHVNKMLASRQ